MREAAPYRLNSGPYSSHTLLLASMPAEGAGRTVLDVGCSDGYLADILSRRGYAVTGIDLPRPAGATFPPSVRLVEADLDAGLPPLEGTFDFVICADVLEHLRRPEERLVELRTVLGDSGRLVASLPNSAHAYVRLNVLLGRFPRHDHGLFDRTHLHFYGWSGWVELLASVNFVEGLRCSGVPVGLALPRWEGSWWVRLAERIAFGCARLWKGMCAYQFIVTARPEKSR